MWAPGTLVVCVLPNDGHSNSGNRLKLVRGNVYLQSVSFIRAGHLLACVGCTWRITPPADGPLWLPLPYCLPVHRQIIVIFSSSS